MKANHLHNYAASFARCLAVPKIACAVLLGAFSALLTSTPVMAQPSSVGQWDTVKTLPWRPVHSVLMKTGTIMFYPASDDPREWNPSGETLTTLTKFSYNPFCNGHAQMPDGKILFTGGHNQTNNWGLWNISLFNPDNKTWKHLPDMTDGRWYPSQIMMANGDILTVSGTKSTGNNNSTPDVLQISNGQVRRLTNAVLSMSLYPAMFLAPNGQAFIATATSRYLNTSGGGTLTTVANRIVSGRDNYGSACMYEPGKVIYTGGGDAPVATTESIDLNAGTPAWSAKASMPQARRQHNATILPDGRVLVTGGSSSSGFNTADGSKPAIVWNPANNTWTTWATEANYRGYHSEAVLLPDARVISVGGDGQANYQIFSPPYLFAGTRPSITSAPTNITHGSAFTVGFSSGPIGKVTMLRPASVTHTKNMNQRYNSLSFTVSGSNLTVTAPANANVCPPGFYMLFIVKTTGEPSVSRWIHIGSTSGLNPSTPAIPTGLTATALSSTSVRLNWTDASSNESGFKIERRLNASAKPWSRIATVGAGVTTYTNTGLTAATSYRYRIRSYNSAGHSPYTAEVTVTTP
ncbi:MAG: galactose oxidase-like domain-containing protein [Verrucomicrobiota bacterium]